MDLDVEATVSRELHQVADSLEIPALPTLPQEPPRAARHWRPLLAAASVVLVAGALAVAVASPDGEEPDPVGPTPSPTPSQSQPASPSPSRTETAATVPTTAPTIPYVIDQQLIVDGERVPGTWWSVTSGEAGWLALRRDYTWWWGRGSQETELPGPHNTAPVLSPNGRYVSQTRVEDGQEVLTALDLSADGESLGSVPLDLGSREDGTLVTVRAVTDDGRVIAQGLRTSVLWLPLAGGDGIDLTDTAAGQVFGRSTSAGLDVSVGDGGQAYLAELSDSGELSRVVDLPSHDDLAVSPGGAWLVWTGYGTTQGDVLTLPRLNAQTVDGSEQATIEAPDGWGFRVRAWAWEDDDHLVSPVLPDGAETGERMARCSVEAARCVLIRTD